MLKKIFLLTTLQVTILMAGSFVMTKGNPILIKSDDDTRHTTAAGCQGTYNNTVAVNSISALENAVTNANTSTKIVMANGTYTSSMILSGNSAPVCIQASTQNQAQMQNKITLSGNNITIDGFLLNGSNGRVYNTGTDNRVTKCTWDDSDAAYWIESLGDAFRFEIDSNTFKNKTNNPNISRGTLLRLETYTTETTPSAYHIHHNYFYNILRGSGAHGWETIQLRNNHTATDWSGPSEHGYSGPLGDNQNIIIEYNLFEEANGESELISVKTHGVTINNNTFKNSYGGILLRQGHNTHVHNNYIIGNAGSGSGGIQFYGSNQHIHHNYIEKVTMQYASAIEALNGGDNGEEYLWPALNHNVHDNYITDCDYGMQYGRNVPGPDIAPSGSFINNTVVGISSSKAIYINSGAPMMDDVTISPNTTTNTPPGWDMSGVLSKDDVGAGN